MPRRQVESRRFKFQNENAFHRRNARPQSRSFARQRRSPSTSRADCNGYVCHWLIRCQIKTETARASKATDGVSGKHGDDRSITGPLSSSNDYAV
jgi:hypothetical protein